MSDLNEILNIKVKIGLQQQGKMDLVQQMLSEGCTWDEIGSSIGWEPVTLSRWYAIELQQDNSILRDRVKEFKAENAKLKADRQAYLDQDCAPNCHRVEQLEYDLQAAVEGLKECVKMCDAQAPALPMPGYREFVIKNLANALIRKLEGKEKP
jgi:hypothetical protein